MVLRRPAINALTCLLFGLLAIPARGEGPSAPRAAAARQVVVSLETSDPALREFEEELKTRIAQKLLGLGVVVIPAEGADPQTIHHLGVRITQMRTGEGNIRYFISGRASLLRDAKVGPGESGTTPLGWALEQTVTARADGASGKGPIAGVLSQVVSALAARAGLTANPVGRTVSFPATPGAAVGGVADVSLAVAGSASHKVVDFDFSQIKVKYQPPAPPYPPLAKIAAIQGTVVVELLIDTAGQVEQAAALQGPPQLRAASEAYAMQWQFEPALLNGAPQQARFRLTLPFRLRGRVPINIQQAVLEVVSPDPSLRGLLPELKGEAETLLKRLGVVLIEDASQNSESAHHLRVQVSRPVYGGAGLVLSLRCCLLKDVQSAATSPNLPGALRTWSMEVVQGSDPTGLLKGELRRAFLELVAVPEIVPKTLPAAEPR